MVNILTVDDPCSVQPADFCADEHAECVNNNGEAVCMCHKGYYGDGTNENPCEDIDECSPEFSWYVCVSKVTF